MSTSRLRKNSRVRYHRRITKLCLVRKAANYRNYPTVEIAPPYLNLRLLSLIYNKLAVPATTSRLRPLQLLLPPIAVVDSDCSDCVRVCSAIVRVRGPIAPASAATSRLRPLQLLLSDGKLRDPGKMGTLGKIGTPYLSVKV